MLFSSVSTIIVSLKYMTTYERETVIGKPFLFVFFPWFPYLFALCLLFLFHHFPFLVPILACGTSVFKESISPHPCYVPSVRLLQHTWFRYLGSINLSSCSMNFSSSNKPCKKKLFTLTYLKSYPKDKEIVRIVLIVVNLTIGLYVYWNQNQPPYCSPWL